MDSAIGAPFALNEGASLLKTILARVFAETKSKEPVSHEIAFLTVRKSNKGTT
jgi:hypothetical protein